MIACSRPVRVDELVQEWRVAPDSMRHLTWLDRRLGGVTNPIENDVMLRPEIVALPPYRQGKPAAADAFKLSSNENPFPPLPGVVEAVSGELTFNRYPDALAGELREALAERFSTGIDNIHIGNGSVSILQALTLAAAGPGDEVIYAWRSFEAYPGMVTIAGATSVQVPLTAGGANDLDAMAAAVTERTRLVIVCSPNNPTGPTVRQDDFERFMAAVPSNLLIVLDEAYFELIRDPDAVDGSTLLGRYPNLVVLRTFSKAYGLAGVRVGYGIGPIGVMDAVRATAVPLSVTGIASRAALASLEREAELFERVEVLVQRRETLIAGLRELGLAIPESQANFIWFDARENAAEVGEVLDAHGIVARVFAGSGVRVSIGEEESLEPILAAAERLVEILPAGHPLLAEGQEAR